MSRYHQPVLVNEVTALLQPDKDKNFIDATIGGGGHTKMLLEHEAIVLGLDQDPEAIAHLKTMDLDNARLKLVQANFTDIENAALEHEFSPVDGILFDLGVSSHQFDTPSRGFSFQAEAPLDMRMSPKLQVTAKDLVNGLGKKELYELFTRLAQEKRARQIANAIISARRIKPIETTSELAEIVTTVKKPIKGRIHPATKAFLALRIAVNDELNNLKTALPQALRLLKPHSRLVVISFHQGEDRIVKHFFRNIQNIGTGIILTKKPITPGRKEQQENIRSRSAKLRAFEKLT